MIETNESLLDRVKSMDAHEAWKLFYEQYWAVILAYARKLGLNQHQAEEVLQETMVALMRQMPDFTYDRRKGRFRNFLLTIVHRKSLGFFRRAKREQDKFLSLDSPEKPASGACGEDSAIADKETEVRWRESILEVVLNELARDARLGPETMAIFRAYVVEGRPAAAVAAEFGVKENAVYQIKNRLSQRVQDRVSRRLRDSDTTPA